MSMPPARRPPSYIAAYITLVVAFVAAVAVVVVLGAVRGFSGSDRYGSVPMPGRELLELPQGDVTVYFQEAVDLGENESLVPPGEIRLDVRPVEGGERVELARGGISNEASGGFGTRVSIGKLDIPDGGEYSVAASHLAEQRADPAIVLGDDLLAGFGGAVVPGLLALAAGCALAAAVAVATRVRRRRMAEAGPSMPQ